MGDLSQSNSFLNSRETRKWPSKNQWKQFFKILTKGQKIRFFFFLFLVLSSFVFLAVNFYLKNTKIEPALGGIYIEGVVGQPQYINPIYSPANDIDRDLVQLIFSSLIEYDKGGNLVPGLAQEMPEIKEEGKIFEINLKENLLWDDQKPLTADDVIFTIKTTQNDDRSPLRPAWIGVEVEKISDRAIRFKLKNPSASFVENLTLKIIPKHIWQDIPFANFKLATYNLKPIGSGPFKFEEMQSEDRNEIRFIKYIRLLRNPNYFGNIPKIQEVKFIFFDTEEKLTKNLEISLFRKILNFLHFSKKDEIKSFSMASIKNYNASENDRFFDKHINQPRYFAVFFNPEWSKALSQIEVRKALNHGTNKKEIIERVFLGQGKTADSPILPDFYGLPNPTMIYEFDAEKAKDILNKAGFAETLEGNREKIIRKEADFSFKNDLKIGSQGKEVTELQKCLTKDPEVYPSGEVTNFFGNSTKDAVIKFQEKYAKEILEPGGLKEGTGMVGKATRDKLNALCAKPIEEILSLKISLATVDQPIMIEIASLLKGQWKALGVDVEIKRFDISALESDIIKKRGYDMLLFGEVLGSIPDPYPFWHSTQKKDPGLNLALYENKNIDKILEEARQILDPTLRNQKYEEFQNLLIDDAPVVFLSNPDYIYFISKEVKGVEVEKIVDPSKRFIGIENWYINTKRGWK